MSETTEANLIELVDRINNEVIEEGMEATGEVHYLGITFTINYWEVKFLDICLCSNEEECSSIEEVEEMILVNLRELISSLFALKLKIVKELKK